MYYFFRPLHYALATSEFVVIAQCCWHIVASSLSRKLFFVIVRYHFTFIWVLKPNME